MGRVSRVSDRAGAGLWFAVTLGHLKIVPAVFGLCTEPRDHTVVPVDEIVGGMTVVVCPL